MVLVIPQTQVQTCSIRRASLAIGVLILVSLVISAVGCRQPVGVTPPGSGEAPGSGPPSTWRGLEDVTAVSGVDFTYRNGREAGRYTILESLGGGAGLLDYDGDGRLDLFLPGGGSLGPPNAKEAGRSNDPDPSSQVPPSGRNSALYRGRGGGRFDDESEQTGVGPSRGYTHGVASADFDNDGFADVLVTGYGGLQLLHNLGDGTFEDLTEQAGLSDPLWSTSAGWGDFDGDGNLDLYVTRYVDWSPTNDPRCPLQLDRGREICSPIQFKGIPDSLYHSLGNGVFAEDRQAVACGEPGKGLGVLVADLDVDGDTDVYVANDTTRNFLFRNDGQGGLHELVTSVGAALDNLGEVTGSMGVDLGDFDNDGLPDIGVANYDSELFALYRQTGGMFLHSSSDTGLAAVGTLFVGWGTAFLDLDLDGDLDLIVSNGHVLYHPESSTARQLPIVLINDGGRFDKRSFAEDAYLGAPHHGRGLAIGDLNDDGAEDVVISHNNEPAAVLLNQPPVSDGWLSVRLIGRSSNRDAIGAHLTLEWPGGRQSRQVKGASSYLSQCDRRVVFGWGANSGSPQLQVRWPSGSVQRIVVPSGQHHLTLIEPPARSHSGTATQRPIQNSP